MRDLIQKTIKSLKNRIKSNLDVINQNQVKIKEILKQSEKGQSGSEFDRHYEVNKGLLAENNDLIKLQLTLINFLEKYRNTPVLEEKLPVVDIYSITDQEEIFDLTVKGVVEFDETHPLYDNVAFIDELMTYYRENEEYEKCQRLKDIRNSM